MSMRCVFLMIFITLNAQYFSSAVAADIDTPYPDWAVYEFCSTKIARATQRECDEILAECAANGGGIDCIVMGHCTYRVRGELKSRSLCSEYGTMNSITIYFDYSWENGNHVSIEDGNGQLTMNGVIASAEDVRDGTCFLTNKNETFCFHPDQNARFANLEKFTSNPNGVWITGATRCQRDKPVGGLFAVIENKYSQGELFLSYWEDEVGDDGSRWGIEGRSCSFNLLQQRGRTLIGQASCGGEYLEDQQAGTSGEVSDTRELSITFSGANRMTISLGDEKLSYRRCMR